VADTSAVAAVAAERQQKKAKVVVEEVEEDVDVEVVNVRYLLLFT
jgi:hypothetical protein